MAEIGYLGDVVFEVGHERVLTPENGISWDSGANITEHDRHNTHPAVEFTGIEADKMTLKIHLSAFLGVDPMKMIWKLFDYEREGTLLPLVIGNHAYGMYRWVIKSTSRVLKHHDNAGNLMDADVTLNLVGYTK